MLRINEFIEPGVYQHYKGDMYVVTGVVTHMDDSEGKMQPLTDPLICYRDLQQVPKHVNGKLVSNYEQTYARPLSEFVEVVDVENGTKRFTSI